MKRQRGVTLLELLIGMTLLGIVLGLGVPGFTEMNRHRQLVNHGNSVVGGIHFARSEAMRLGRPVSICGSSDGASCSAAGWADGWIVFTDNGVLGNAPDVNQVLRSTPAIGNLTSAGQVHIRFTGAGLRDTVGGAGDQVISLRRVDCGAGRARSLAVSSAGRVTLSEADC